ncbi:hypothetical protein PV11_08693 [Exophiala sideris]|uniref:DUF6604 domain-containing protein n=1 Tax=Exophiala sideris TaxID=1016849 RepID=A0A0D1Y7K1_9EURO|nr:hypothetical protein PV11_08693 [Exophiala sideris]
MATQPLPPDMVLTYKRYKQDTETVAGWLAETAAQAGYNGNTTVNTTVNAPKEPKLKGRARKLARDAAKQSPNSGRVKHAYTVHTNQFVEMAQKIVNLKPKVILTHTLRCTWERAIRARRRFFDWFRSKTTSNKLSDEKHAHFAAVLEVALKILKPCWEQVKEYVPPSKVDDEPKKSPLIHVTNIFQYLEVEDIVSDQEAEQKEELRAKKPHTNPTGVAHAHIDFDDEEHGSPNLSASLTNLAVDLIRRAEADFEASLQRPSKYPAAQYPTGSLPYLIFKLHLPSQGPALDIDPDAPGAMVICGCPICDFLLYMPWIMAKHYVGVLKDIPPVFPTPKNDFRVEVPGFPSQKVLHWEYYHAQNPSQKAQTQLREILPNFCMLSLMLRGAFVEDEILHAARHIVENRNVPLWVSFALQVQLDIQHLDTFVHIDAFKDLKIAYADTKARHKEHKKWTESLDFEIWPKDSEGHLNTMVSDFGQWIEGSKCGKRDVMQFHRLREAGVDKDTAFNMSERVPLLENFPVTCGTMKTEMYLEWHILGLRLVNYTGHVVMLCHLYNTLRSINATAPIWPDMELVIRNQDSGRIFVGPRPSTVQDGEKRLYLAMGMSTASLAKDSKGLAFKKTNAKQREYEKSAIAGNLFDRWMGQETRKHDEAAYRLQELLFGEKYRHDLAHKMFVPEQDLSDADKKYPDIKSLRTKIVRTLISLSEGFTADMPAFMFDYFSMERQCFEIFRIIKEAYRAQSGAGSDTNAQQKDKTNSPISFTLSLFDSARGGEEITRNMRSNKAESKARGPAVAKYLKSQLIGFDDEEGQDAVEEILKLARQGRAGEWISKHTDISEYSAARNVFAPMLDVLGGIIKQNNGDLEIRKLRPRVCNTAYGIFLFRSCSLHALYGPEGDKVWQDIVVAEAEIQKIYQKSAHHPGWWLLTAYVLRQRKVMFGEGEDSFVEADMDTKMSPEQLAQHVQDYALSSSAAEDMVVKEDWENVAEIFGKQTRDTSH